jgi:hypothetical protein
MRGEFVDLTAEETRRYIETGELPERVERWLDSYDSRHIFGDGHLLRLANGEARGLLRHLGQVKVTSGKVGACDPREARASATPDSSSPRAEHLDITDLFGEICGKSPRRR